MRTHGSPELLEQRRRFAARMFQRGDEANDIADVLDAHVQTVRQWRREFEAGGMDALLAKPHPGPACRLTNAQKQELVGLLAQPPGDFDLADDVGGGAGGGAGGGPVNRHLWTGALIARLIERRFGVRYHHDHVGVMLHGLGYSAQKPMTRPRERDQVAIDHWLGTTWPAIAKRSRERRATIVFADEVGYGMLPSIKKQWAPVGQTPVMEHRNRHHEKVSVIGGLAVEPWAGADPTTNPTTQPTAYFAFYPDASIKGFEAAAFVRQLVKQIAGPITLIWDNLNVHRSRVVKATLADHPQVEAYHLPPYAPELNPIEGLWCHSKHHQLAQFCPHDLEQMTKAAKEATTRSSEPALLHACIRQTGLHHALYPSSAQ